jgi:hypothetical protein
LLIYLTAYDERLQMRRLRCARVPLVLIQTTRALLPTG